ncbi:MULTISPECIES: hypothetical protein [Acetobacter]|nr:hypothetical protein [Acetobacter cibinongensis]GAN60699.1 hypothetical protein Abci_016_045 [Acetobacter cibinongensis]GBQ11903.1 hypothetical protein AA0482_0083 [Acetobacter cibinongensis NRIC 0482]GEL58730.1 hypothetical protein ACI01nite_13320 [Acetobacter cibinongensis]
MQPNTTLCPAEIAKPVRSSRSRIQARAAHIFATCAMGSWFLLGIIPVVVILYSFS